MQSNIILFDIDYTLFDVGKFKDRVFDTLEKLLPDVANVKGIALQSYDEIRKFSAFNPELFTAQFLTHIPMLHSKKLLQNVWTDKAILLDCLYPETKMVLEKISQQHNITLGIFSSGLGFFQKAKIETIAGYFSEEHMHIHTIKDEKLSEILSSYNGRRVILVDDYMEVLEKAKAIDNTVVTMWVKRGKFAERAAISATFVPDFTIDTLIEVLPILDQFDN